MAYNLFETKIKIYEIANAMKKINSTASKSFTYNSVLYAM